ncbi:unnamed protein product, partial [marine sediment metagenome]
GKNILNIGEIQVLSYLREIDVSKRNKSSTSHYSVNIICNAVVMLNIINLGELLYEKAL